MSHRIDPLHGEKQQILKIAGVTLLAVGVVFSLIGFGSFFSSFGSFEPPRYFWCAFVGLPMAGLGATLCKFAFMGAVTRYISGEVAPVGKDVVNYMVDGTKGSIRDVAAAVGEGLRVGDRREESRVLRCQKCHVQNAATASFCNNCGTALAKTAICSSCGTSNDSGARFCNHCGAAVTSQSG